MTAIAGIVAVVHLALAAVPRRWFDEDLMLAIGRHHLDWGTVDQPPLTPLLARLSEEVRDGLGKAVPHPSRLGRPEEFGLLAAQIVANPMLNGESIRLDGAIRMPPR